MFREVYLELVRKWPNLGERRCILAHYEVVGGGHGLYSSLRVLTPWGVQKGPNLRAALGIGIPLGPGGPATHMTPASVRHATSAALSGALHTLYIDCTGHCTGHCTVL
jgi:hypothetical protein